MTPQNISERAFNVRSRVVAAPHPRATNHWPHRARRDRDLPSSGRFAGQPAPSVARGDGRTVTFSLDGRSYEIDLTAKNAGLRNALRPYIEAGRPIKISRRRPTRTRAAADTRTVKEWARANGHQVRDRGRIPKAVIDAFDAAN